MRSCYTAPKPWVKRAMAHSALFQFLVQSFGLASPCADPVRDDVDDNSAFGCTHQCVRHLLPCLVEGKDVGLQINLELCRVDSGDQSRKIFLTAMEKCDVIMR